MATTPTVSTYKSHVSRAWSFYNDTPRIMFAIGKTTPWTNENQPPNPVIDKNTLDELIGFKKVDRMLFVIPDPVNGTIVIDNVRWTPIEPDPAIPGDTLYNAIRRANARWVYVETVLESTEFPNTTYREIGLYSRILLNDGVSTSQLTYNPSEILDSGILEAWKTRPPVYKTSGQREMLSFVLEF